MSSFSVEECFESLSVEEPSTISYSNCKETAEDIEISRCRSQSKRAGFAKQQNYEEDHSAFDSYEQFAGGFVRQSTAEIIDEPTKPVTNGRTSSGGCSRACDRIAGFVPPSPSKPTSPSPYKPTPPLLIPRNPANIRRNPPPSPRMFDARSVSDVIETDAAIFPTNGLSYKESPTKYKLTGLSATITTTNGKTSTTSEGVEELNYLHDENINGIDENVRDLTGENFSFETSSEIGGVETLPDLTHKSGDMLLAADECIEIFGSVLEKPPDQQGVLTPSLSRGGGCLSRLGRSGSGEKPSVSFNPTPVVVGSAGEY